MKYRLYKMSNTIKLENTSRRDALIEIEKKYQKIWADEKVFEVDSPSLDEEPDLKSEELHEKYPKYFVTMCYPYMNGVLHVGHCFTLSKAEFATGFERLRGKRALFPLGFHCTGMPIKASADKIKREIEEFGEDFSGAPAEEQEEEDKEPQEEVKREDVTKFTAKKSKVASKQGRGKYQFEIMAQLGIPKEEVSKFADLKYWLEFFPPLAQRDVTALGSRVDWRRSFITTDINPYYDAFVRWQLNRLRDCGKIKFGERYTIYSEKDGQACLDHDRSSGEGLNPQEYTGIKIKVSEFADESKSELAAKNFDTKGKNFFLIAATLRPETMYGQSCCFVSPKIDYGLFDDGHNNYFICTERAFKNMSFQGLTPKRGEYRSLFKINGKKLIGSKINPPLAILKEVYVLPMESILPSKGTGVVTCVPSDSPDDYVAVRDLANKPDYYKIKKEWVPSEVTEIIHTQKYGNKCAELLVNDLKIQSPKDSSQLAIAKEHAYKEGYYNGTMLIGKYAGDKVEQAKTKVRDDLVASNEAFVYSEPEGLIISRSGDECIVSLEDQWYIDYGEESWKSQALECLASMQTFSKETRHGFEGVLDWLKNWAVTRNFGLGTRLPWDPQYLVESLSDSTVYMAYYTICHFLHSDYYGRKPGEFHIKPEDLTDEVFDFIFTRRDNVDSKIPLSQLKEMRRSFEYFYPLDLRVSGKDLVPNHLTFFIYSHVALFPKKFWPRGVRTNGHLMLNNNKMSKSTGNFLTLEQAVKKFGSDACRIALADAGDTVEDANFEESNANAAILRLTTLKEWCEQITTSSGSLRNDSDSFFDAAFDNEMNELITRTYEQYDATNYKGALKYGLFDFQASRDYYRDAVSETIGMSKNLVFRYIEAQVLMLAPITPHFSEYIYREILGKKGSIQTATFPTVSKPLSKSLSDALEYLRDLSRSIREAEGNVLKKKKGTPLQVDPSKPSKLTIFVCSSFPQWQDNCIEIVRELYQQHSLNDNKYIKEKVGKDMKRSMPFISLVKQRLQKEDPQTVFNRELTFDEVDVIKSALRNVKKSPTVVNVQETEVIQFDNGSKKGVNVLNGEEVEITVTGKIIDSAVPGQPGVMLTNL